jgi:hypothetical protein
MYDIKQWLSAGVVRDFVKCAMRLWKEKWLYKTNYANWEPKIVNAMLLHVIGSILEISFKKVKVKLSRYAP